MVCECLGHPSGFFNKEAFRLCALNSLNEETKGVFQSNTCTLETTLASTKNVKGKAWPFDTESLVNGMVVARKSATPRPGLRFNNVSREDPHVPLMSDDEEVQTDWKKGDESGEKDDFVEDCDVVVGGLVMIADDDLSCLLIDDQDDQIEELSLLTRTHQTILCIGRMPGRHKLSRLQTFEWPRPRIRVHRNTVDPRPKTRIDREFETWCWMLFLSCFFWSTVGYWTMVCTDFGEMKARSSKPCSLYVFVESSMDVHSNVEAIGGRESSRSDT
jgi:hypothetical protein